MGSRARRAVMVAMVALLAGWAAAAGPPTEGSSPAVVVTDETAGPGPVAFKVVEGSYLVDDCRCGKPAIMIPVQGTFTLVPSAVEPLFERFVVRGLRLGGGVAGISYQVTGAGTYRRGGMGFSGQQIKSTPVVREGSMPTSIRAESAPGPKLLVAP